MHDGSMEGFDPFDARPYAEPSDNPSTRDRTGRWYWQEDVPDGRVTGKSTLPVTIYLSDGGAHEQVEAAVAELLAGAGLEIVERDEPVIGSWFRRMAAAVKGVVLSPAAREGALSGLHAADQHLVLAQDAAITRALMQGVAPVLESLQPTKDAVVRAGALLVVKSDWVVNVVQLTAAQQAKLDHQPGLARSPHEIFAALAAMDPRYGHWVFVEDVEAAPEMIPDADGNPGSMS